MTSPATDSNAPRIGGGGGVTRRLRWGLWALGLVVAGPTLVTLIGAATSPPHVRGVPTGHLVYLDADQPSEKTTTLRGLYLSQPDGAPRLLVHENEPQDSDAGIREWITEPAASPDGTQVAYLKQDITLLEETHNQDTQLWVMSLQGSGAKPRELLDLTKLGLKQIVGLTWTADGRSIVFSQDDALYALSPAGGQPRRIATLKTFAPLKTGADSSATQNVSLKPPMTLAYSAHTRNGDETNVATVGVGSRYFGNYHADVWAVNGKSQIAMKDATHPARINVQDLPPMNGSQSFQAKWGWSLFGRRHITSLRWSPDGRYIGYTVSKPPVPEDELFYLDTTDGKTYQLPVRTGRAAWDWTR